MDARPTVRAVAEDIGERRGGRPRSRRASTTRVAAATAAAPASSRPAATAPSTVVLSGGVFQNRRLLEATRRAAGGLGPPGPHARSGCRRTTAASPTGSWPWPPRGWRQRRERRCSALTSGWRGLANGEALVVVLAVALLLGLRHASDPDHLAAVSTLIASEPEDGTRARGAARTRMGLGPRPHAGAVRPADRAVRGLPPRHAAARRGGSRRPHDHVPGGQAARALAGAGGSTRTPIATARSSTATCTRTTTARATITRTSRRGGWGARPRRRSGSAACTGWVARPASCVLLLATIPDQAEAVAALVVLALGTAMSMAVLSSAFGYAITRGPVSGGCSRSLPRWASSRWRSARWYTLGAVGAVPYVPVSARPTPDPQKVLAERSSPAAARSRSRR